MNLSSIGPLLLLLEACASMKITRTWTTKHWCESVKRPEWPFAYSKYASQIEETKGRVSTNEQDVRHECDTRGVQSKCHICETIDRGDDLDSTCHFQLQGVPWTAMSKNIPTVSDIPWAVGGSHRYDFGGNTTSHVCMYTSGQFPCQSSFGNDYASCKLRCWGFGENLTGQNNTPLAATNVHNGPVGEWPNHQAENAKGINATPWTLPAPTALWSYPTTARGEGPTNPRVDGNPSTLPQGFTFTLAGSAMGEAGFVDGIGQGARFHHPEGVAVDNDGYVYVADTGNHAIRVISPKGRVTTLAGTGFAGSDDGLAVDGAQFSSPSGIAVWRDWEWWPSVDPDTIEYRNGNGTMVIFVADTGNHRIRKVTSNVQVNEATGEKVFSNVLVKCFAGWCGSAPQSGLANGAGEDSRFDSPRGISVSSKGNVYVADTNNHLIRVVDRHGRSRILAGSVEVAETNRFGDPLEGCPDPCLAGVHGSLDGNATESRFSFPSDVAVEFGDERIFVTDRHHIRRIDLVSNQVATLAGTSQEGERDGYWSEASFNKPDAVATTSNGIAYVADSISCRIRRVSPPELVATEATCLDTLSSIMRPSGCSSYNPPVDNDGLMATPVAGNLYYNYLHRHQYDAHLGHDFVGRGVKDCVGSPPPLALDKKQWNDINDGYAYNENLVIDDGIERQREDPNDGSVIKIWCKPGCSLDEFVLSAGPVIYANHTSPEMQAHDNFYAEDSSVCGAAIHAGVIQDTVGGLVDVALHGELGLPSPASLDTNMKYGVQSEPLPKKATRVFSVSLSPVRVGVQTIAGAPTTLLGDACGMHDAVPPQAAKFGTPTGLAAFVNASLDDAEHFLFVADRNNHAIRATSAVCSFPCENGGRCVGSDKCDCEVGWEGVDCSLPSCASPCGPRQVCVAPNTCSCIPGYTGSNCAEATCVQVCEHGGVCSAPDTCSCKPGWFDSNCTTPVCEQTCGNGGNCTAPDVCSCPSQWMGTDCRVPKCDQECKNGGSCVAPNTCACPPQWSGHDCGLPVCHQGFFVPDMTSDRPRHWLEYRPCNFTDWCHETDGFDCSQKDKLWSSKVTPGHGPHWRFETGRKVPPPQCMMIEIGEDVLSPFQYVQVWDNSSTPHFRYSPKIPYGPTSMYSLPWNAILEPRYGFTQPWSYQYDRQVALVELHNVTQGAYGCANGGVCIEPDVCACANGWIGFDCRTPVCEQGYYEAEQDMFVKGTNLATELTTFEPFMGPNRTGRLDPFLGYSNPEFSVWIEHFLNDTTVERALERKEGRRYGALSGNEQGGYSCSIRSVTQWEDRSGFIFDHPNYFSRYMDSKVEKDGVRYTSWEGMGWNATHQKSRRLDYLVHGRRYVYTDEGHMIDGVWTVTGEPWAKGVCIIEFHRVCDDQTKTNDLWDVKSDALVQDTDIVFRPRISYDDKTSYPTGRWMQGGGECVDHVIRGCFNNGTCVGPNQCLCAKGWEGQDCKTPRCTQTCLHNGNCTLPDTCTCEKGWAGNDCSQPLCAQECNNGGRCVAPDTCECKQWQNEWRDGRAHGGVPLFQMPNGEPQLTGWTGYDCSTPICVQAERFRLNVDIETDDDGEFVSLGGRGKDGTLECSSDRCPAYNEVVTSNDGRSFQTGCGYDPVDTGCCYNNVERTEEFPFAFQCVKCRDGYLEVNAHNVTCREMNLESWAFPSKRHVPLSFMGPDGEPQLCGRFHNPGGRGDFNDDYSYYVSNTPNRRPEFSNRNWKANITSNRFLCGITEWESGDYIDGRHIRVNHLNYQRNAQDLYRWTKGPIIPGEGIYECYNGGSCIGPDVCTCRDGYSGFDCQTPLCRHEQADGQVVGCQNGGICQSKDDCHCIQTVSLLWTVHDHAARGLTGWTGSDCSIPICVQGYFDPFCSGPFTPGGEGCYRCANGGTCVEPDVCACADGWSGFDCRTPICEAVVTPLIRQQLMTVDQDKLRIFEQDPCGMVGFYKPEIFDGTVHHRGNCTLPNQCTCLCKAAYDRQLCEAVGGKYCNTPFQDPLFRLRNVLAPNEVFGTRSCSSGYEGFVDERENLRSCHLTIYEGSWFSRNTVALIVWAIILFLLFLSGCLCLRRRLRKGTAIAVLETQPRISGGHRRNSSMLHPKRNWEDKSKEEDFQASDTLSKMQKKKKK